MAHLVDIAAPRARPPVKVVIASPLGQGGRGGIDRIVDELRIEGAQPGHPAAKLTFMTTRGQGHILLAPLFLSASILRLAGMRLVGQVDVLHVNLSSHGSTWRKYALCKAASLLGIPYIIHLHGSRYQQFLQESGPFWTARIGTMFQGAARILVLGEVWRKFLIRHISDVSDTIQILPNASRAPTGCVARQSASPGRVTILFLGKVGPRKGVSVLIDALDRIRGDAGWHAIVAGDGDVEEARQSVAALGLADRITLTGWVGPAEVETLLSEADILTLPSFNENLPMSVIEAMAAGLAVVATPVGAVEDIVRDGETGLLVPVGDAPALADALGRLVDDAALRNRLGKAAQAFHRENLDIVPYYTRLVGIWGQAAAVRRIRARFSGSAF